MKQSQTVAKRRTEEIDQQKAKGQQNKEKMMLSEVSKKPFRKKKTAKT